MNNLLYVIHSTSIFVTGMIHSKSPLGDNALHLCAVYSNTYSIRPLLKAGAKLSEGDSQQNTLLHIAAKRNDVDLFKNIAMYHNVDRAADKEVALSEFYV